jgi:hypothetical protein
VDLGLWLRRWEGLINIKGLEVVPFAELKNWRADGQYVVPALITDVHPFLPVNLINQPTHLPFIPLTHEVLKVLRLSIHS